MSDLQATRRRLLTTLMGCAPALLLPWSDARRAEAQQAPGIGMRDLARELAPQPGLEQGSRLVLLGTRGGPGIDLAHQQTASAVVVDGQPYLVDCGYGALRQLVAAHVPYLDINQIFLTHLHDDHTGDLSALMSFQWTNGKESRTEVIGPAGTERLVAAALALISINAEIRTVDEGRTVEAAKQFSGRDQPASASPQVVYRDAKVTVSAVENTHYSPQSLAHMPHRSLAYRFDCRDRSIVFSGDTAYSENLVGLAHGADLFVCEMVDRSVLAPMRQRAQAAAAAGNPVSIYRHVAEAHSSAADVARMATRAHVRTVVLNHMVTAPTAPEALGFPVTAFVDAVRQGFTGEVIVGQDLMVL